MTEADTITFAVNGSNSFYKLELSKTLIRFAEFDFTYFWEQSIEAGRNARKTGRISQKNENMAISALVKCHPYVEACAVTEFSSVVLDCIIAYICHSEGIGLEELWARCISPKSLYEKAIFNRVSEYKTGRGINQWINIVRMQEYVRSKLSFIYETEGNVMVEQIKYRTRREYFDLALAVAANETGCPMTELPSVRKYTPAQLPDSVFMMGRVSKNIYRRLSEVLSTAQMCEHKRLNDHNRDQTALDAFSYVKDMPRPADNDMSFALEAVRELDSIVYMPDSFKAIIDLEFTCMEENGIYLAKCPRCGRFFVRDLSEKSPYCNRVNSSGRTCAEMIEDELGIVRRNTDETAEDKPEDVSEQTPQEINESAAESPSHETVEEPEFVQETFEDFEEEEEIISRELPKELGRRCQKVYNAVYKRVGRFMTDTEFREWSKYLSDMKENYRKGYADESQVEEFLEYWETAVKKQNKRLRRMASHEVEHAAERIKNFEPESFDAPKQPETEEQTAEEKASEEQLKGDEYFNEAAEAAENNLSSGISPAGTETIEGNRILRPFTPPKYNTVLEAMLDGKYKSDEILSESVDSDDLSEIRVNGKKVTLPEWERIERE